MCRSDTLMSSPAEISAGAGCAGGAGGERGGGVSAFHQRHSGNSGYPGLAVAGGVAVTLFAQDKCSIWEVDRFTHVRACTGQ